MEKAKTITKTTIKLIARIAAETKGENIVMMDMRKLSAISDWFVLISAGSARRMNTISEKIQEELSKKGMKPGHVEGKDNPLWALLDYGDVIVHIFYEGIRDFYGLERLWQDAKKERFEAKCKAKTS